MSERDVGNVSSRCRIRGAVAVLRFPRERPA
jgi:hypothetical protein